jgi:ribosomal protein L28
MNVELYVSKCGIRIILIHNIKNLTICCKVLKIRDDKGGKSNFNRFKKSIKNGFKKRNFYVNIEYVDLVVKSGVKWREITKLGCNYVYR